MDQPVQRKKFDVAQLRQAPLFAQCDAQTASHLTQLAMVERHPRDRILFISGDEATSFFMVQSGWVKLFRETLDGTQAIIDIVPPGSLFGETAIFEDDTYTCSAEIIEDAELVRLPLATLKQEIERDGTLALDMLKSMTRHRRQQDKELEHRNLQNAPQRIGCFLLRLLPTGAEKNIVLSLPYDKALLAARLGMQPETFSRALQRLKAETGIRIKGAQIEIDDVAQLAGYTCAACTSQFPCSDR